jgi:hypothetical protein
MHPARRRVPAMELRDTASHAASFPRVWGNVIPLLALTQIHVNVRQVGHFQLQIFGLTKSLSGILARCEICLIVTC